MQIRLRAPLLAILLSACQPAQAPQFIEVRGGDFVIPTGRSAVAPQNGIGVARQAVTLGDGANGAHIIFLNFDGVKVTAPKFGYDDSSKNTSQLAKNGTATSATIPAFDVSPYSPAYTKQTAVGAITNYMQQFYAPFNAQIVNVRPVSGRYTMCVVGGQPTDLLGAGNSGAAGIAPLDCGNVNEPDVVYAFSEAIDPSSTGSASESLKAIAVTCAQESAHSFGLGHTQNKMDIMFPQLDLQQTSFGGSSKIQPDGSGMCGNGTTQDSAQMLKDVIGVASTTSAVISVAFVAPLDQSTVPRNFTVEVGASETGGAIDHIDLQVGSGSPYKLTTAPYLKNITNAPIGQRLITATAYDAQGNFQSATVNIFVDPNAPTQVLGCNSDQDCNTGLKCVMGSCTTVPTTSADMTTSNPDAGAAPDLTPSATLGELGSTCTDGNQCESGLCLVGPNLCTSSCDPKTADACPANYACQANGSEYYCQPSQNGTSGCSAVGGRAPAGAWATALLVAIFCSWARRRRSHV